MWRRLEFGKNAAQHRPSWNSAHPALLKDACDARLGEADEARPHPGPGRLGEERRPVVHDGLRAVLILTSENMESMGCRFRSEVWLGNERLVM